MASAASKRSGGYINAFDYVRGIGSHMVLICHLAIFLDPTVIAGCWMAFTLYSVTRYMLMCFFIISGYLIAQRLFAYAPALFSPSNAHHFFVARCARIYPPLLAALALELCVYGAIALGTTAGYDSGFNYRSAFQGAMPDYQLAVPGTILGLNGPLGFNFMPLNTPLWTLGYELWFYWLAMLGFTFWYGGDREGLKSIIPIGLILALVVALRNLNFLFLAAIWLYGFIGYVVAQRSSLSHRKVHAILTLGFASGVFVTALQIARQHDFAFPDASHRGIIAQLTICASLACLLVKLASTPDARVSRWHRTISRMSGHSYTLYVLHMPLLVLAHYLLSGSLQEMKAPAMLMVLIVIYAAIVIVSDRAAQVLEDSKRYKHKIARLLAGTGITAD